MNFSRSLNVQHVFTFAHVQHVFTFAHCSTCFHVHSLFNMFSRSLTVQQVFTFAHCSTCLGPVCDNTNCFSNRLAHFTTYIINKGKRFRVFIQLTKNFWAQKEFVKFLVYTQNRGGHCYSTQFWAFKIFLQAWGYANQYIKKMLGTFHKSIFPSGNFPRFFIQVQ